ncbi:metal-sensitive transcriptional regulator [Candidatus Roizmanbacteria bacterium]|nr:metal-sensitive transcriptional regulator [Candidatus Roizmanbacteria bacterium]
MLDQRINRIVGQLRGIQRMIHKRRDCNEILQQISAVKKAIDSLSKEIAISDMGRYVAKKDTGKIERIIERIINI